MKQEQMDKFAKALGISPEVQQTLDTGSNHDYRCKCGVCLQWWVEMGPDGGEPGNYGPFDAEEVIAACEARGMKFPECHATGEEP